MDHKTMFNKMLLSKRLNLANKNNCFFPEAPPVDKLTFRENETSTQSNENKENLSDLINRTIKMKDKTISNVSNLFSSNTPSCEKFEKSTPGFNKHQKKFESQDIFLTRDKPPSPAKKCTPPEKPCENSTTTSTRLKKNKKTSSCLWESTNLSFDQVHNMSIDSNKEFMRKELKHSSNLNLSTTTNTNISNNMNSTNNSSNTNNANMARKLKLPANHFWKKFIGKNAGLKETQNIGQNFVQNCNFGQNSQKQKNNKTEETDNEEASKKTDSNEMGWVRKEIMSLKEKVEALERNEKVFKEKTERLEKKYRKLKKEKEGLKKVNNYLIEQNKGILTDLKEVSSKSGNKSFETVLKSLNEFEIKLKNSIVCSNKLIIS